MYLGDTMKKKTNLRDRDNLSTRDIGHFPKVSLSRRFHCTLLLHCWNTLIPIKLKNSWFEKQTFHSWYSSDRTGSDHQHACIVTIICNWVPKFLVLWVLCEGHAALIWLVLSCHSPKKARMLLNKTCTFTDPPPPTHTHTHTQNEVGVVCT